MNNSPMLNTYQSKGTTDEQTLYDHLIDSAQTDSSEQILDDFHSLFIESRGFRKPEVNLALERIVRKKNAEQSFNYIFNRCFHIVINRWQMQPHTQRDIPRLINLFNNLPTGGSLANTSSGSIRQLVKNFTSTEQFVKLKRLSEVIDNKQGGNSAATASVGNLIHRYPCLYDYCLLGDDSSEEHQQTVRRVKHQTERHFEMSLSRYVTYKVRTNQTDTAGLVMPHKELILPVKNPTLLSDHELNRSLKHYVGKVEGGQSYKAISQSFASNTVHTKNFGAFKDDLYEYVLGSMDSKYSQGQFNKKLFNLLQNTHPECNQQKPTEFLMMRTSSQLLNFLIVDSPTQPEHYVFIDLITNLGVTRTVGLFLKIVLFSKKVRPYLEKRFSILFNHYESFTREGVPWLVRSLENMQLALSVHFGKVDLSGLKQSQLR